MQWPTLRLSGTTCCTPLLGCLLLRLSHILAKDCGYLNMRSLSQLSPHCHIGREKHTQAHVRQDYGITSAQLPQWRVAGACKTPAGIPGHKTFESKTQEMIFTGLTPIFLASHTHTSVALTDQAPAAALPTENPTDALPSAEPLAAASSSAVLFSPISLALLLLLFISASAAGRACCALEGRLAGAGGACTQQCCSASRLSHCRQRGAIPALITPCGMRAIFPAMLEVLEGQSRNSQLLLVLDQALHTSMVFHAQGHRGPACEQGSLQRCFKAKRTPPHMRR